MKIPLKDLTYLDDLNFLKIILSSADRFPGLYRFNSSWKRDIENTDFMKVISFVEACLRPQTWKRDEWLSVHEKIYQLGFGERGRNSERKDIETGELLRRKSLDWIERAQSISLAAIEIHMPVSQIIEGNTYYMMGSLIRFAKEHTYISYNNFDGSYYAKLNVGFNEVSQYIEKIFSPDSLSELFFKAEVIGKLVFDKNENGRIEFNVEQLNELLFNFTPNSPVFGSVDYPEILPIRFAKLLGVSNVCK